MYPTFRPLYPEKCHSSQFSEQIKDLHSVFLELENAFDRINYTGWVKRR